VEHHTDKKHDHKTAAVATGVAAGVAGAIAVVGHEDKKKTETVSFKREDLIATHN
jgi:hypothetical protein